jgi:hypothetical protein
MIRRSWCAAHLVAISIGLATLSRVETPFQSPTVMQTHTSSSVRGKTLVPLPTLQELCGNHRQPCENIGTEWLRVDPR